jgi:hypothetical protein
MVEVVNMRTCSPPWGQPGDVRIDRTTKWGNPFPLTSESKRDEVCDLYIRYMRNLIDNGNRDIRELIHAKRLGCWCKPYRCHGDYLKRLIEEELDD